MSKFISTLILCGMIYLVERIDYFVERTDYTLERSDLERNDHGKK